jgi:membrane-bound ClpP family serine protease
MASSAGGVVSAITASRKKPCALYLSPRSGSSASAVPLIAVDPTVAHMDDAGHLIGEILAVGHDEESGPVGFVQAEQQLVHR